MTVYYRAFHGSLVPASSGHFDHPEKLVEIADSAIKPYKPPKFKVGDRVRTTGGTLVTVDGAYPNRRYALKFADGSIGGLYRESELRPAPTLEDVIAEESLAEGVYISPAHSAFIAKGIREAFPKAEL